MGADILCIKDMAGLLRPQGAKVLIKALREEVGLPIHLHTHASAGCSEATLLAATEAGCEIVDGAISSMSGLTSQPSLNALIAAMEDHPRKPRVPLLQALDKLGLYWKRLEVAMKSLTQVYGNFYTSLPSRNTRWAVQQPLRAG